MHILLTLIVGMFVGAIARMVIPGREPAGIAVMMLLGIGGAGLASFTAHSVGWYQDGDAGPGVVAAFIGAVVVLALYRVLSPRKMASR